MRDLSTDELGHVYGAGGRGCSPQPPSCSKGSKSKKSKSHKSKSHKSKSHRSRGRGSRGC